MAEIWLSTVIPKFNNTKMYAMAGVLIIIFQKVKFKKLRMTLGYPPYMKTIKSLWAKGHLRRTWCGVSRAKFYRTYRSDIFANTDLNTTSFTGRTQVGWVDILKNLSWLLNKSNQKAPAAIQIREILGNFSFWMAKKPIMLL